MIENRIKWVPLKFDLMAKKIFGNNDNQNQIKFLLNQILGITPKYVKVLKIYTNIYKFPLILKMHS